MYLVLTAILALNVSAEILEAFKTVDRSLINSNKNIEAGNANLFTSFEAKLADPKTNQALAKKWYDFANQVKKLSDNLDADINKLKTDLKTNADLTMKEKDGKMVEDFKEDNLDASTRLFETNGEGPKLEAKLKAYKAAVLAIDPEISAAFINNFPVEVDNKIIGNDGKVKDFTTAYFHMTPTVAALTILSKIQNNVKNAENQVVTFCHNKIGEVVVHMDQVGVLVGQSSSYLMPGEELTITAGVGAYSSAVQSNITVNGSPITLVNGQGEYKTKAGGGGKHTIQVSGSFTGEDGKAVPISKTIEYTVGQPSGAAISLDKMNVFYVGLDNPITIGSPTGMEKTGVVGKNCTINGSGSSRTVKVTGSGECSITVSPQGSTPLTMNFRIKRIPEPSFMVGSGKARMPSVDFKSQQFCRADMGPDFIYDVRYSVVSATVYFAGANFSNVVTASITGNSLGALNTYMQRCGPGSVVSFDNIKVSGPDGVRIIEPKSFALY